MTVRTTTQRVLMAIALAGVIAAPALAQASEGRRVQEDCARHADRRRSHRLAAHYRAHAVEHEADAKLHEEIAAAQRKRTDDDDAWDLARDASHYADHSREAAEALRELAQLHDAMAQRHGRK